MKDTEKIDYLAKDFNTFKDTMVSAMKKRVPGWKPTSEADLDMVLIELLSAAADELSYYQDRVMNEAYLSTSRKRVSIARHARLMDYHIYQGHQASTWLAIELKSGKETQFNELKKANPSLEVQTPDHPWIKKVYSTKGKLPYMSNLLNKFTLYTWNGKNIKLKVGSTSADIQIFGGASRSEEAYIKLKDLILNKKLTHLLIQEQKYLTTRKELKDTGRKSNRQLLRLIPDEKKTKVRYDPVLDKYCLHIIWDKRDRLKQDYQFIIETDNGPIIDATLFHGNLVRIYYGETKNARFFEPNNHNRVEKNEYFYERTKWGTICKLPDSSISYIDVYNGKTPNGKIAPKSTLTVKVNDERWEERIDLINSRSDDPHFIVETDETGKSHIRFGNGCNGKALPEGAVVDCEYPVGIGYDGNIGADTLTVVEKKFRPHMIRCWNPFVVTNGREPEKVEEILDKIPEVYPESHLREIPIDEKKSDFSNVPAHKKDSVKKTSNKSGLPKFDYGLGTYSTFREAFVRLLDRKEDSPLKEWTYRGPDDPAIAIMEGASILCDILSFYQNLYANEAYLRTSRQRESLTNLVKLNGLSSIEDLEEKLYNSTNRKKVSLYERLPSIYKERDEKQQPPYQLKTYLEIFETIFSEIYENIESLYHDLFIETCADWAIPYIGNLFGISCPKGDAWASRKCVAEAIRSLRRKKSTRSQI